MSGVPKTQRPTLKVILVGSSGVGKTCLISTYFRQSFDFETPPTVAPAYSCSDINYYINKNETIRPTVGANSITANVSLKETKVVLNIWDTAGQERYQSVSKLFFRDSDVAFVCFEAGEPESTKEVPNWVKRVRDEVPCCAIFFVMMKCDLHTPQEIAEIKAQAKLEFSEFNGKDVFVTSALAKEGINELFQAAAEMYKSKVVHSQMANRTLEAKKDGKGGCC